MKRYSADSIRNIAVAGHQGTGKTSLAEAGLFVTGAIDRLGRVEEGTAKTDFDENEVRRRISINLAIAPVEWNGTKLNLIDTPGYLDFVGEVGSAMRVADAAVLLVSCELSEILTLSDRILVMYEGRIVAETTPGATDERRLGQAMTGRAGDAPHSA